MGSDQKLQEKKLDVAEMRMLRWMSGVTKLDRMRNDCSVTHIKVGNDTDEQEEVIDSSIF